MMMDFVRENNDLSVTSFIDIVRRDVTLFCAIKITLREDNDKV